MSVNIKLDKEWHIGSDSRQYFLYKGSEIRGYYSELRYLLEAYLDKKLKESECESIKELHEYLISLTHALNRAIEPLKIEVRVKNA